MNKYKFLSGLAVAALAVATNAAHAQDAAAAQADAPAAKDGAGLADIIVTANRREENAQDVPVSVVAFSGEALEERSITRLGDLTRITPGLRFAPQGGGAALNVVLRGLQRTASGNAPNAVISYFADVPLYFSGSNITPFDMGSVQVLKGPQGTLFGRNAIGGAIILTPEAPNYEFGGYVRGTYGNYDTKIGEGAINLPIVQDKIALRVAGHIARRDGYTKVIGKGGNPDDVHTNAFRVSLLVEPAEGFRNNTVFDYYLADEVGPSSVLVGLTGGGAIRLPQLAHFFDCNTVNAFNPGCAAIPGVLPPGFDIDDQLARQKAAGKRTAYSDVVQNLYRKQLGVSNKTEIDVTDGLTLRNIFGYRETGIRTAFNVDGVDSPLPLINGFTRDSQKQVSDELHAFGNLLNDRLEYLVGLFYIKESPNGKGSGTNFVAFAPAGRYTVAYQTVINKAAFGQVSYKLTDALKVTGGLRYNSTKVTGCSAVTPESYPFAVLTDPKAGEPSILQDNCPTAVNSSTITEKQDAWTYNVAVDWQISDDMLVYATHRKGFREGGLNYPLFNSPCTTGGACVGAPGADLRPYQTIKPEIVKDVEIGFKSEFPLGEGKARFNLALFHTWYTNGVLGFNTSGVVPTGDPAAPQFTAININVGDYKIKGLEAELTLQPVSGLSWTNTAAYTDSKLVKATLPNIPQLSTALPLPASPKWAVTSALRWVVPIHPLDGDVTFNADLYHQGSFYVTGDTIPKFTVANTRLEWSNISDSGLSAAFYMRNIFNKTYSIAGVAAASAIGVITRNHAEPRMYGLELGYKF
jgi:iron complex outermembrane receptor protein